jgi:hypothetical protein
MSLDEVFYDAVRSTRIAIRARDIWVVQEVNNLWIECVYKKTPFREIVHLFHNSLLVMKRIGLNRNFFTRSRWLDVETIVKLSDYTNWRTFYEIMGLTDQQVDSWKLSSAEWCMLMMREVDGQYEYYPLKGSGPNSNSNVMEWQGMVIPQELVLKRPETWTSKHLSSPWSLTQPLLGPSYQLVSTRS